MYHCNQPIVFRRHWRVGRGGGVGGGRWKCQKPSNESIVLKDRKIVQVYAGGAAAVVLFAAAAAPLPIKFQFRNPFNRRARAARPPRPRWGKKIKRILYIKTSRQPRPFIVWTFKKSWARIQERKKTKKKKINDISSIVRAPEEGVALTLLYPVFPVCI